jgi:hypothetical protein
MIFSSKCNHARAEQSSGTSRLTFAMGNAAHAAMHARRFGAQTLMSILIAGQLS